MSTCDAHARRSATGEPLVDVCILAHGRRAELFRLLESLRRQTGRGPGEPPPPFNVRVIDNSSRNPLDPAGVAWIRAAGGASYEYLGVDDIAAGRNRALAGGGAPFVAFVDDDEVASPTWLAELCDTARRFGADVVCGPNRPVYDEPLADGWVARSRILERPCPATGVSEGFAESTANCLIRRATVEEINLGFSSRFGRCGGSDTDFYRRARALGLRIVWCAEAVVEEHFPADRLDARWLLRRAIRCGGTQAACLMRLTSGSSRRRALGREVRHRLGFGAWRFAAYERRMGRSLLEVGVRLAWTYASGIGYLIFATTGVVLNDYRGPDEPLWVRPDRSRFGTSRPSCEAGI